MKPILTVLVPVLCAAIAVPAFAGHGHGGGKGNRGPSVIQLPTGFGPEGITTAGRSTFFVGSRVNGAIYRGSLRSGRGEILVEGAADKQATGLKVDRRGRLFVSAAGSKVIRVYDAHDGDELATYPVADAAFVNDVIITRRGAYFTDSGVPQLYFIPFGDDGDLGELERIPLTGDLQYDDDPQTFELNGIEATRDRLIAVQSRNGKLFSIDPESGVTDEIAYTGGDGEVDEGDGLLLHGRKLYVVENQDDRVTVLKLRRDLSSGRIVREIDSDRFVVPTTIAASRRYGKYVVNAKFGRDNPGNSFEVVRVPKR